MFKPWRFLTNYLSLKSWRSAFDAKFNLLFGHKYLTQQTSLDLAAEWLLNMQKQSGGFADQYSLLYGLGNEFPETTGYLIPTLLNLFKKTNQDAYLQAARKAGNWLLSVQNAQGYFMDNSACPQPMVFDTAQTIFGFLALYKESRDQQYLQAARQAGNWIISQQEENGSWIKSAYQNISHSYYTRVALALLLLWDVDQDEFFKNSAIKNLNWVLTQQENNGFFNRASFFPDNEPVLHTIAYTIEGLLKSSLILENNKENDLAQKYFQSALRASEKLLLLSQTNNILPGFLNSKWEKARSEKCLTGLAQIAEIFFILFEKTNEEKYLREARHINRYLRSKQIISSSKRINGALAGSWPFWGKYMPMGFPLWANKFFIDSLLLEIKHQTRLLSIAIFPNDPMESYLKKGEMRENYFNPNNLFQRISIINPSDRIFTPEEIQKISFMTGQAQLEIVPIAQAKQSFKKNRYDFVRTYGLYQPGLLASLLARFYNLPFIISLHTNYDDYRYTVVLKAKQYLKFIKQIIWKYAFEINILKSAQHIISVYRFADIYPESLGIPRTKRSIIYNRVSPKVYFKNQSIAKRQKFTVVNVNSFIPAKNQEVLVRALQYADFNLILVGQGSERQRLIDLSKDLKVNNKVEFIASIPNQELPDLYNQCHAYATIINIGGIGIGVIESMACGLPIVTSKLESEPEPELLGFDNCVFAKNDAKDVAEKIKKLMEDKKYYQDLSQRSLDIFSRINGEKGSAMEKNVYISNI